MKTAIEWLVEKTFSDYGKSVLRQEIKMALQMEKQQIIDAYQSGDGDAYNLDATKQWGEQYYTSTYGS